MRPRSWLTRERLVGLVWQIVVVGIAIAIFAWLWSNALHNLSVRRISTGFAFLGREAGMPIADTWLAYIPKNTYLRAFIVGVVNTLRVAVIGIVLATVLGTLIGIAKLSSNWLLSRLAAIYVETLRNIPLLLQLLFWYVLMQGLPAARAAWKPIEGVFLSNRGLILPSIPIEEANLWVLAAAMAGLVALYLLRRRLIAQHFDIDGGEPRQQPVRRQPRDADQRADHGRQHDADDSDAQRVDDADDERAQVGVLRRVVDPGIRDRHAGFAAEEGEAGRDAPHREIMDRVRPQPGDDGDRDGDHQDLPEQAGDAGVAERKPPGPTWSPGGRAFRRRCRHSTRIPVRRDLLPCARAYSGLRTSYVAPN